ncbi:hypothetical protein HRbin20_01537 [bacterium HR20]|nr:hypothetical protein HRbin20_01537 [bacterium HR20]
MLQLSKVFFRLPTEAPGLPKWIVPVVVPVVAPRIRQYWNVLFVAPL